MSHDMWDLTPREGDVLVFLIAGKSNREIAAELDLSISTVKAHLSSLYGKLGVSSRTQAALIGVRCFPMLRALATGPGTVQGASRNGDGPSGSREPTTTRAFG